MRTCYNITQDHRACLVSSNRECFSHYRHISYFFNKSYLSLYVYTRGILRCFLRFWPLGQNPAGEIINISKKILHQPFLELRERNGIVMFFNRISKPWTFGSYIKFTIIYFSMSNTSPVYICLILCLPEKLSLYEWA